MFQSINEIPCKNARFRQRYDRQPREKRSFDFLSYYTLKKHVRFAHYKNRVLRRKIYNVEIHNTSDHGRAQGGRGS